MFFENKAPTTTLVVPVTAVELPSQSTGEAVVEGFEAVSSPQFTDSTPQGVIAAPAKAK